MHIGEPQRIVIVEPVEDPVPREQPVPEKPAEKPSPAPNEPEPVRVR
jgi:hypothetical protein